LPNVYSIQLPRNLDIAGNYSLDSLFDSAGSAFRISLYTTVGTMFILLVGIGLIILKPLESVVVWESATLFFASLFVTFPLLVLKFLSNVFDKIGNSSELNNLSVEDLNFIQKVYGYILDSFMHRILII